MASSFSAAVLLALLSIQGEHQIQADLAWGGAISTPEFTEITLRAATSTDATVAFELAGPSTVVVTNMQLHNGEPAIARMPVVSGDLGGVVLRYSVQGAPWREIDAGRLERAAGNIVLVGESAIEVLGAVAGTTIVATEDLPAFSSTYTHVAAVALGVPGQSVGAPTNRAALAWIRRTRLSLSMPTMLSRKCCTIYSLSPDTWARSTPRWRACASLNWIRRASGRADSAIAKMIAPSTPAAVKLLVSLTPPI